jgi:putative oxidoreductase
MQPPTILYGPLILRLALAASLALRGLPKLLTAAGRDPGGFVEAFRAAGMEPAAELVVASGVLELVGGLALGLGVYARTAAVLLAVETSALAWRLHFPRGVPEDWMGRSAAPPAVELTLLVVAGLVCMALTGAGALSLDHRRARDAESKELGRARLRRRE